MSMQSEEVDELHYMMSELHPPTTSSPADLGTDAALYFDMEPEIDLEVDDSGSDGERSRGERAGESN